MSLEICHVKLLPLFFIVLKIILVQSIHSAEFRDSAESNRRIPYENALGESKKPSVKNFDSRARNELVRDPNLVRVQEVLNQFFFSQDLGRGKRDNKGKKRVKLSHDADEWENWNEWTPCSVTCGRGRKIRWRHCLQGCDGVETEMQEKTCQLPDCVRGIFSVL
ncbi:uncharacterized protein LOC126264509 isoform X2 [Aethina tumida]|uniref:uncharacterized protein LOC126264509 isoform X2 n=1 Tax=Aethina tumida TaxID=116153 RepID=UPI002147C79F|nr:uncharacterized protein LOC126264509 isoform X2 [Aethina tumida]